MTFQYLPTTGTHHHPYGNRAHKEAAWPPLRLTLQGDDPPPCESHRTVFRRDERAAVENCVSTTLRGVGGLPLKLWRHSSCHLEQLCSKEVLPSMMSCLCRHNYILLKYSNEKNLVTTRVFVYSYLCQETRHRVSAEIPIQCRV